MKSVHVSDYTDAEEMAVKLVEIAWQRLPASVFPPSSVMTKLIAVTAARQVQELQDEIDKLSAD